MSYNDKRVQSIFGWWILRKVKGQTSWASTDSQIKSTSGPNATPEVNFIIWSYSKNDHPFSQAD